MNNALWYRQPAGIWDEALPIGNGKLGAMLFGGIDGETIELNEDTLWSGIPRDINNYEARRHIAAARKLIAEKKYREAQDLVEARMVGRSPEGYQTLGKISLHRAATGAPQSYTRSLDIENSVWRCAMEASGGKEDRSAFASFPDALIAFRSERTGAFAGDIELRLQSPHPVATRLAGKNRLVMTGRLPTRIVDNWSGDHPEPVLYEEGLGLAFACCVEIHSDGVIALDQQTGSVKISTCKNLELRIAAGSTYADWKTMPSSDPQAAVDQCLAILDKAANKSWDDLVRRHTADYRELFSRLEFRLGAPARDAAREIPTDERLAAYAAGGDDTGLEALYFNYARYLLISCSRPGSQAANLQGIWNPYVQAPWMSDYTININTEMNYWPGEACGLHECQEPLFDLLADLSEAGGRTARIHYGARGWCAHHNVDLWRMSQPTNGDASWAFFPFGGAWLSRQLWEAYLFRQDLAFLRERAWPILRGSALFVLDWLVDMEDGRAGTSPSTSPENKFFDAEGRACSVAHSSTIDLSISLDILGIADQALGILGGEEGLHSEIKKKMARIRPFKIGSKGQLLEWPEEFSEPEPGHRHVSHLYGLHPSALIGDEDAALRKACERTLELRLENGGGHTGWSAAWLLNMYARLKKADSARAMLRQLLTKSTLKNLLDNHPPFQIDGNFGACAAFTEMLVQSQHGFVEVAPCIPAHWRDGSIRGLRIRGGLTVDLTWEDGEVRSLVVSATKDREVEIRLKQVRKVVALKAGKKTELIPGLT